jgi:hypothetical protein
MPDIKSDQHVSEVAHFSTGFMFSGNISATYYKREPLAALLLQEFHRSGVRAVLQRELVLMNSCCCVNNRVEQRHCSPTP